MRSVRSARPRPPTRPRHDAVVAAEHRARTGIHDVAPAPDGGVWFSAQRSGHLGWFDPKSGSSS